MDNNSDGIGSKFNGIGIDFEGVGVKIPSSIYNAPKETIELISTMKFPTNDMAEDVKRLTELNQQYLEEMQKLNSTNNQNAEKISELSQTIAKMEANNKHHVLKEILIGAISAIAAAIVVAVATKYGVL